MHLCLLPQNAVRNALFLYASVAARFGRTCGSWLLRINHSLWYMTAGHSFLLGLTYCRLFQQYLEGL